MIFNYPSFGFPSYYRYNRRYYQKSNPYIYNSTNSIPSAMTNKKSEPLKDLHSCHVEEKNSLNESNNECFEIFGIKLYYDDILLICLIFFLYNEGVQDQYLFISLILLLLS